VIEVKNYPSIPKDLNPYIRIYAFDKLDGSQIRAEFNTKRGFYKFGSKNCLIDISTKPFGKAISLVKEKYEKDIAKVCEKNNIKDIICFFEFYGPNSFAGQHTDTDTQTVTLFDANPYKQGILEPLDFIRYFGHLDTPNVLYIGQITEEFIDQVKNSTLQGMTFEGVVAKASSQNKAKLPVMFKIKSRAWLDKLRGYCGNDESLFSKLS